jgi:hypothetical protein
MYVLIIYLELILGGNPECGYSQVGGNIITLPETGLIFKPCLENNVLPSLSLR